MYKPQATVPELRIS